MPMIHSAVMINLRKEDSDYLTYNSSNVENYNGPVDDIITFALSANQSGENKLITPLSVFSCVKQYLRALE